jgi:hypothetical protein
MKRNKVSIINKLNYYIEKRYYRCILYLINKYKISSYTICQLSFFRDPQILLINFGKKDLKRGLEISRSICKEVSFAHENIGLSMYSFKYLQNNLGGRL